MKGAPGNIGEHPFLVEKFFLGFSNGNFIIWILYTACLGMKKSIKYILQTAEDIYSRVMIFYGN